MWIVDHLHWEARGVSSIRAWAGSEGPKASETDVFEFISGGEDSRAEGRRPFL